MRNRKIDIMKGIAIVLMVLGHSGFPFTKFIYLFHMAVFFMISGYLYKINQDDGIKGIGIYIVKKIKTIWLPYFIWNAIFTVFNNLFISTNIYAKEAISLFNNNTVSHTNLSSVEMIKNIVKGIFMVGRTEMGELFGS